MVGVLRVFRVFRVLVLKGSGLGVLFLVGRIGRRAGECRFWTPPHQEEQPPLLWMKHRMQDVAHRKRTRASVDWPSNHSHCAAFNSPPFPGAAV